MDVLISPIVNGSALLARKFLKKNESGSSPQPRLNEKTKKFIHHEIITV